MSHATLLQVEWHAIQQHDSTEPEEDQSLQDAADDLVQRLLTYVVALRATGIRPPLELAPTDLATMDFLYQLGEIAAAGGDIRSRLFS